MEGLNMARYQLCGFNHWRARFALNRLLVHACYLANTCERNLLVIFLASALARNPVHILVKLLVRHLGPREEEPCQAITCMHVYGNHNTDSASSPDLHDVRFCRQYFVLHWCRYNFVWMIRASPATRRCGQPKPPHGTPSVEVRTYGCTISVTTRAMSAF